jgi:RNA polymerase sigma factor (sigma-70 family)
MNDTTDMDLLRQYAEGNSETAFAALVSRHVNLVYSAALRKTGQPDAAEEITQAVFILLAQKARRLPAQTIVAGWLYQAARWTAASFLKREVRRARREHEAYMQTELRTAASAEAWPQLAPLLEDAMGDLPKNERAAILLRFFGGKSFSEIAAASGVSENAAKKRVTRALEKLHRYFSRRGVSSTTTLIAGLISANSVHAAPAGLAKSVTALAAAKGATAGSSTLTLIKGALKIMAWTKAKTAIVTGVIILCAATSTTIIGIRAGRAHHPVAEPSIGMSANGHSLKFDIQPDGTALFQGTIEETNNTRETITTDKINDGDSTWRFTDESGMPLKISKLSEQPRGGVLVTLPRAVPPGGTSSRVIEGKMGRVVLKNRAGEYECGGNSNIGNIAEAHVVEFYRLPAGAVLVEKGDGISATTNSDRIELTMDRMVPPNGSYSAGFRYRLDTAAN